MSSSYLRVRAVQGCQRSLMRLELCDYETPLCSGSHIFSLLHLPGKQALGKLPLGAKVCNLHSTIAGRKNSPNFLSSPFLQAIPLHRRRGNGTQYCIGTLLMSSKAEAWLQFSPTFNQAPRQVAVLPHKHHFPSFTSHPSYLKLMEHSTVLS